MPGALTHLPMEVSDLASGTLRERGGEIHTASGHPRPGLREKVGRTFPRHPHPGRFLWLRADNVGRIIRHPRIEAAIQLERILDHFGVVDEFRSRCVPDEFGLFDQLSLDDLFLSVEVEMVSTTAEN